MVKPGPDPTTSIYALMAYFLRFLRKRHGMTQDDVGAIIKCTKGQVSKYETGVKLLDRDQCEDLDREWATGGLFTYLIGYAKLGTDVTWPVRHRRYQREALVHKIFSNNLIPLPFQTEGYARGLLEAGRAAGFVDDAEVLLRQRMDIQAAMLDGRPQIWAVLDEIALRRMGTAEVMAAQRDRLLEMSMMSNVSLRVLPLSVGPNIGVDGSFHCFTLPGRRLAAFAGTVQRAGRVIDDQDEADSVAVRFDILAAQALNEVQSRERIAKMGKGDDGLA